MVACHDMIAPCLGSDSRLDIVVAATLCYPLTTVRDIGRLAPVGAVGLGCLAVAFCAVVWFTETDSQQQGNVNWTITNDPTSLASGFGVLAYCFGIVPIVPQYAASMQDPAQFRYAQRVALATTTIVYTIVGVTVAALARGHVAGNVLDDLPSTFVAAIVRLAMAAVCIVSAPVAVVVAAEIAEAKLTASSLRHRLSIRFAILGCGATFAVAMPSFSLVVSVVGAGAVSFLSFVLPPLVHVSLVLRSRRVLRDDKGASLPSVCASDKHAPAPRSVVFLDAIASIVGIIVVILATTLTARAVAAQLRHVAHPQ